MFIPMRPVGKMGIHPYKRLTLIFPNPITI